MPRNTRYSFFHSLIHWLMALLIITLIAIGFIMADTPDGSEKYKLLSLHKSLGVVALLLIVVRIGTRLLSQVSPLTASPFATMLRWLIHSLLYLLMLVMPLSGLLMSWASGYSTTVFSLFTLSGSAVKIPDLASVSHTLHMSAAYGLAALIALHLVSFFYQQYIKKENILHRISLRS